MTKIVLPIIVTIEIFLISCPSVGYTVLFLTYESVMISMTIHREKAKNEANILHHQLQSLTPKPPSRQEPLFEPKPGPAESSRPQPDIQRDTKYRSPPVYYEHTLSPSAVRKRSARVKRYLSSNDETDDSIMKEISECFYVLLCQITFP